jgi:hypothetical protein
MKENELRVGVYIYYCEEVFEVDAECIKMHMGDDLDDAYRPIPLTEKWLLKFLEVKKFGFTIYLPLTNLKAEIHFEMYKNDIVSIIKSDFAELILDPIKYVHQLQNLYFALTGEELKSNN